MLIDPKQIRGGVGGGGVVVPVAGRVRRSTNQTIPAGAGYTLISFDTGALQQNGVFFNGAFPTEIIIPEDGTYPFSFEATGASAAASVMWECELRVAGAVIGSGSFTALAGATAPLKENALRPCSAGQKVTVGVRHSSATALDILAEGDHSPDVWLFKLNGTPGTSASLTTVEIDLGAIPAYAGKFVVAGLAGLTIGKPVAMLQAVGPYTGKGTLPDECEMDAIAVAASVTSATEITAYWRSATRVARNHKFNFQIGG